METVKQIYRKDYIGEEVKSVSNYTNNQWAHEEEYISNPFDSSSLPLSNRAVVIGNGVSRLDFNLKFFLPSRETTAWGEVGPWIPPIHPRRFNTYGCNALYREYRPDFLIATGDAFVEEIINSGYCNDNVVYASKQNVAYNSGKFTYVPQDPQWNSGAIAAYLAAFDGHKRVFMLGFDGIDSGDNSSNIYRDTASYAAKSDVANEDYWVRSLVAVMNTYSDVEFIRVAPVASFRSPEAWKYCANYRTISFNQFVREADV